MAKVREILVKKGPDVRTIGKDATVLDAARLMNEHKIGALVVMGSERIEGIFTERDILRRVVGELRDPARTLVAEVMTADVFCAEPDTSIDEARSAMMHRRIRHLPVVDKSGRLLGLISIGDLNAYQCDSQEQTIHLLREYLHGRA